MWNGYPQQKRSSRIRMTNMQSVTLVECWPSCKQCQNMKDFIFAKEKENLSLAHKESFLMSHVSFLWLYVIVATGTLEIHANYINSDHFIIFFTCICQYELFFMYRGHTKGSYLLVLWWQGKDSPFSTIHQDCCVTVSLFYLWFIQLLPFWLESIRCVTR